MAQIDLFGGSGNPPDKPAKRRQEKPPDAAEVVEMGEWRPVVAADAGITAAATGTAGAVADNGLPAADPAASATGDLLAAPAAPAMKRTRKAAATPTPRAKRPAANDAGVSPAQADPALQALAARLSPALRFGTSSWSFPGWAGLVYGGTHAESLLSRAGLAAYAQHPLLRAAGIDRTFYAPLAASDFAPLAAAVPEDFRFLVKAHAALTTPFDQWRRMPYAGRSPQDHFLDAVHAADCVVGPALEGLGTKLGVILLQFPPLGAPFARTALRFADHLARFLEALPPLPVDAAGRGPRYAVEVRNREFLGPAYAAALGARGIAHCLNVHPRMPSPTEQSRIMLDGHAVAGVGARPPLTVLRWMLHPALEYVAARDSFAPFDRLAAPDPASRAAVAAEVAAALARQDDVIVIVNNKAEGSAPLSIRELATALAQRGESA